MSQDAPQPPDETACPSCGERILAAAKKCKHCGDWISSQPNPILAQQANYSVPLRIERQEQSGGGGGGRGGGSSYSTSSIGIATQGSVCPQCKETTGFTNTYSMWHWVLAILFFPLGLLCLLFPIKVCARCGTTFGAGVQMAKTVRIIAILYLSAILLIAVSCFGVIAAAGYTAAKAVEDVGAAISTEAPSNAATGTSVAQASGNDETTIASVVNALSDAADTDSSAMVPITGTTDEEKLIGDGTGAEPVRQVDQPYLDSEVEKPVVMAPGARGPPYPDMLRTAGIEGTVLAQFVVDTTGRAEMSTFKVLKSDNDLFSNAVKNALQRMRFLPAEVGGRKVKQLVEQPFQFSLNR